MIFWLEEPLGGGDGRMIYGYQRENCKPCPDYPGPRECKHCEIYPVYEPAEGKDANKQEPKTRETLEETADEGSTEQALGETSEVDELVVERLIPGRDYDIPERLEVRCQRCGHPHAIEEGQHELTCKICGTTMRIEEADIIRLKIK